MSNMSLKWIAGSPEKFEVGMLVVIDGEMKLIGDTDSDQYPIGINEVQKWTYLIRDYELNWHFEMMKGRK
jgi:hypothetical protein